MVSPFPLLEAWADSPPAKCSELFQSSRWSKRVLSISSPQLGCMPAARQVHQFPVLWSETGSMKW